MILKIGGNTPRNSIHRVLERIISNKCAMNCSWKGVRLNYKIFNLTFTENIRGKYFKIIFNYFLKFWVFRLHKRTFFYSNRYYLII